MCVCRNRCLHLSLRQCSSLSREGHIIFYLNFIPNIMWGSLFKHWWGKFCSSKVLVGTCPSRPYANPRPSRVHTHARAHAHKQKYMGCTILYIIEANLVIIIYKKPKLKIKWKMYMHWTNTSMHLHDETWNHHQYISNGRWRASTPAATSPRKLPCSPLDNYALVT